MHAWLNSMALSNDMPTQQGVNYRAVAWSCDQNICTPQELDNFFSRL